MEYTFYVRLNEGGFLLGRELGKGNGEGNSNWKGAEAEIRCVSRQQSEVMGEEVEKAECEVSPVPAQINVVSITGRSVLSRLKTQALSPGHCCCCAATSCLTLLQPLGLQPARSLCPWDFPGKNTGVNRFLLQGILPH